jgi:thiamine-phosphate pyrophosphorylase
MRPRVPRFLVITDGALQTRYSHAELARLAIAGGADGIQFRQKDGSTARLLPEAQATRDVCADARVPFVVNDRLDLALAVDADGLHVGQDDLPADIARRLMGRRRLLGVSAHTPEQAHRAMSDGADYIGFGPVYGTVSKTDARAATGVEALHRFTEGLPLPVLAVGGVRAENVRELLDAGAYGVAVITAVCCAADVTAAAREFARQLSRSSTR